MNKKEKYIQTSPDMFVRRDYIDDFKQLGLTSIDAVFDFSLGQDLSKKNLAAHRSRCRIPLPHRNTALFLKRYTSPPLFTQLRNFISHRRIQSTADCERIPCIDLSSAGIATPDVIAWASQWKHCLEKRSFLITEQIPDAHSLEQSLPQYFTAPPTTETFNQKKQFIRHLADFTRRFHQTGSRHRDYYLCHIFINSSEDFSLIDLARLIKPVFLKERFRLKDLTQLFYSAPGNIVHSTDRLRFYKHYNNCKKLTAADKKFIKKLRAKAWRIADHDIRHGRNVPFAN